MRGDDKADWEDFKPVRAFDAGTAAEKAAEEYDCSDSDYHILHGADVQIWVRRQDNPCKIYKFSIRGEAVPTYYAKEVEDSE